MSHRVNVLSACRIAMAALAVLGTTVGASAEPKVHHVAIQVDQNDPAVMNLALNNVVNVESYYDGRGEAVQIELVAYGPGLHMLREDDSPVKARLHSIKTSMPNVTFSACNVTKTSMEKAEGKPIAVVSDARLVPSGAVRLIDLEEQGWSYLKP